MKKYGKWLWGFLVILALGTAGCSAKKDMNKATTQEADNAAYDMADNGFAMTEAKAEEAPAAESGNSGQEVKQIVDMEKKLIRTVKLGIETEYFDATVSELDQLCTNLHGYVGNSSLDNGTYNRTYAIEMRIPQENLDEFLNHVSTMGKMKIRYKTENTQDVTLDYFDSAEHKKSLEVERDRILQLIEQADSLEYVVSLEDKLSELRYMISSYESQLRRMDNQVSYSTVSIDIEEVKQITAEKDDTVGERIVSGLTRTLNEIKEAFLNFVVWFTTQFPRLVIYAIFIFFVVKIVRRVYRNSQKKYNKQDEPKEK